MIEGRVRLSYQYLCVQHESSGVHMCTLPRETDEGAAAHIWQLLMAAQMPVLLFFAVKWLPKAPRQTLCVLALNAAAVLASVAPVFFLNL
jgi:hypothetical protein